jgi:hypothetical protein
MIKSRQRSSNISLRFGIILLVFVSTTIATSKKPLKTCSANVLEGDVFAYEVYPFAYETK